MPERRLLEKILPAFLTSDRIVYNLCVVLAGLAVAAAVLLIAVMAAIFGTYLLSDKYKLGEAAIPVMLLGVLAAGLAAIAAFVMVLVFNLRCLEAIMGSKLEGKKVGAIHASVFTAPIVQKYFDEVLPEVKVYHFGNDAVQEAVTTAPPGAVPKHIFHKFAVYARDLEQSGMDLIMLCCSTWSPAVDYARPFISTPLLQIDRPMMDEAVSRGRRIGLLATLASTVPSSERLLKLAASEAGKTVEIKTVLCLEAFKALRAGDREGHNAILLEAIDGMSRSCDIIVMAQVSMTALEPMLGSAKVPVLNSARTAMGRIKSMLEAAIRA